MWALLRLRALLKGIRYQFKTTDDFADFFCYEYDKCIKLGGDLLYGVPVMNGNIPAMRKALKKAFEKGLNAGQNNFMLAKDFKPAFDGYWMGAESAPIPNPLLKPGLWPTTPPAPGAIQNLGPNPAKLIASVVKTVALIAVAKALMEALKQKTITIKVTPMYIPKYDGEPNTTPTEVKVNVYDTANKLLKGEPMPFQIANHPIIKLAKEIITTFKDMKKRKPSIGEQFKIGLKPPLPKLPDRAKLIEEAKKKLIEQAKKTIEDQMIKPIMDIVIAPIVEQVKMAVDIANNLPKKPTEAEIKQYVKDLANGVTPSLQLPGVTIPKIDPAEIKAEIKRKTPTKEEIEAYAFDLIKNKIPQIPYFHFPIPPLGKWKTSKVLIIDPFINMAKMDLVGRQGMHNILALYPGVPPVPGPAVLMWQGYKVKDGPKVPEIPIPPKPPYIPKY